MVHGSDVDTMRHTELKIYFTGQIDLTIFHDFVVLRPCGGTSVVLHFSVLVLIDVISGHSPDVSPRLRVLAHHNDVTR